jgi:hypothetical protein
MIERKKTTQDFKNEYLQYKNSFVDFNASVIDYMLDPVPLETPQQLMLLHAARFAVPEKTWGVMFQIELEHAWIVPTLLTDDDKDFIRDTYYRDYQLRMHRIEITTKVLEVVDALETRPFKLGNDRILTRVCGYITDIDICHYDNFAPIPIRKVDIMDIIRLLYEHRHIPEIYIDAHRVLTTEIFDFLRSPVVTAKPLLATGILLVAPQVMDVVPQTIDYKLTVGDYETALIGAVENISLQDEYNRPVIAEAVFFEMEAIPEFPGILTPQEVTKLHTLDGVPQLSEKVKDRILELGYQMKNTKIRIVSCIAVGDYDTYEYFQEKVTYTMSRSEGTKEIPYKDISNLYEISSDLIGKFKSKGLVDAAVRDFVRIYRKRLRKEEYKLSKEYNETPEYRFIHSSHRDDGYDHFVHSRKKYKDK